MKPKAQRQAFKMRLGPRCSSHGPLAVHTSHILASLPSVSLRGLRHALAKEGRIRLYFTLACLEDAGLVRVEGK